jgi:type IV pilus assembly protein PilB
MPPTYRIVKSMLGTILVTQGLVKKEQVEEALALQKESKKRLGQILVETGAISEDDLNLVLAEQAEQLEIPMVTADHLNQVDVEMVAKIPEELAREHTLIAISQDGGMLDVVMADPFDLEVLDTLEKMTGLTVKPLIGKSSEIKEAIERYYKEIKAFEGLEELLEGIDYIKEGEGEEEVDIEKLKAQVEDAPVVKLVNMILGEAIKDRASDIHIEPAEKGVSVRFRIDGVLHEVMSPPKRLQMPLITRVKILSDLDIADRRSPQDGRLTVKLPGKNVDVRVSSLPTVFGEKIVMRLFDKESFGRELSKLGFTEGMLQVFRKWIKEPYGMILVSGPTGSGKTSTLYAALSEIRSPEKNLVTVEDPVEYKIDGINQVYTNPQAGLTFALALRSILRQDPDIIMVGEIRDRETADIAVKSALTGHLVFSTVHANDAVSTVTRLVDLGVPAYLVGSAVNLVLAQRLVRVICPQCKERYEATREFLESINWPYNGDEKVHFYRGRGCLQCKNTGFLGRTAIFEMLEMKPSIRKLVFENANDDIIHEEAKKQGMKTLLEDGLEKVRNGTTTIKEVLGSHIQE